MVADLLTRQEEGKSMDELHQYAKEKYGFDSTLSAIATAITRYKGGMYVIADAASGKITWKNKEAKEHDTRYPGVKSSALEFLKKARSAAIDAVSIYNRPSADVDDFRTANYIVLMIIAWTALFHAVFLQRNTQPLYAKKEANQQRWWELRECLRQYYGEVNTPPRENLQFLAQLRDQIEHRQLPYLDDVLFGECQACLLNFERLLAREFSPVLTLNSRLALALQFGSTVDPQQLEAVRSKQRTQASNALPLYVIIAPASLTNLQLVQSGRFVFCWCQK